MFFSILFSCVAVIYSIIYGSDWTQQTLYNDAVAYIRFPQGSSVSESEISSVGTLISRTFVLTTGRIFNKYVVSHET